MLNSQFVNYKVEAWDTLQHLFKVKNINDHTLHFVAILAERLDLERLNKLIYKETSTKTVLERNNLLSENDFVRELKVRTFVLNLH